MERKTMKTKSFGRYLVLWAGQLMSGLGNGMTAFALGVYVFRQTRSVSSFALIALCLYLPSILLRPLGGVLADRFDRRLMIVIGEAGSASGVIFVLISLLTGLAGPAAFWKLYLGITVSSAFVALQSPAYKASVTDLLTEEQFSKAGGMVQLASSAQHLFSPLLAGVLMSAGSIITVLMLDISTFFIAILAALSMRRGIPTAHIGGDTDQREKVNVLQDFREGWTAVTTDRGVLIVVLLLSLITFFIGFVQTLFGPMMLSFTDARTLGTVQSVSAVGMLLSSLLIGTMSIRGTQTSVLLLGLAAAGGSLFLLGLTTSLFFITGVFFLFFCTLPFINTSADVLIRRTIPNEKQGRAWGIIGVLSQLGYLAAYGVSGILADRVFNPLLETGGRLAPSIGKIIGTGPGRGIAFIFILSGICIAVVSGIASGLKPLRAMEAKKPVPGSPKGVTLHADA